MKRPPAEKNHIPNRSGSTRGCARNSAALAKSRRYSVTFTALRRARIDYRRAQRHPGGERDPWGRALDDRFVLTVRTWEYAGTGYATTAERALALAAAARAREQEPIAREETWTK
jgi:Replication initiator protein, pSAM2